jgi:Fe-S cluster biosynthesis and repair protein YggX
MASAPRSHGLTPGRLRNRRARFPVALDYRIEFVLRSFSERRVKIEFCINHAGDREGFMTHMVYCVKFKKEMPGLDEPPFDNALGQKVYDNVSQEAWRMWTEHCKMLLNEYRLNPARREDQEVIVKQLEMYFFGEGSAKPKEYVPPK